jgi:O-antigen/teichoic acid export membrane protein
MASGGSLLASVAAQLITFAVLARFLGVEQFGLYAAMTALTNVGVQMCGLGAQESLIRRVAQDRVMYPVMLGHATILSAGSGIILVLVGLVVLPAMFEVSSDVLVNIETAALILVTNIMVLKAISLPTQAFLAHSDFASANKIDVFYAIARTVAAVLACFVFGVSTTAQWAYWHFGVHLVVAAVAVFSIRGLGRPRFELVRNEIRIGVLFSTQFIFRALRQNADMLVLSAVAGAEVLGSYSLARRILDSSYTSVEALNRLIYPGSASAAVNGVHGALERTKKVLVAACVIATASATAIFILAPLLPWLFGDEYVSLVGFTQILCWAVIATAIYAVALEALGASGLQGARAAILNSTNLIGAGIVALATWWFAANGTFAAYYLLEISTAVIAWVVLLHFAQLHRRRAGAINP